MLGTGSDEPSFDREYRSPSRLKGVVAPQLDESARMPPFAHEFAHHWANWLSLPSSGLARIATRTSAHWGMTSVFGQLGGFDEATLDCSNPPGAELSSCSAEASGKIHYTLGCSGKLAIRRSVTSHSNSI